MDTDNLVTCHWLTPTHLMADPYRFESEECPWTCLRDGYPRPLTGAELCRCAACARWEPRTYDSAARDLIFEAWGTGDMPMKPRSYDEARHDMVMEAWGVQ